MSLLPGTSIEDRIAALPCWNGQIEISPLKGGLSNESYLVRDSEGGHVVRFGKDYPFHHVSRERELMTARAAFEAGFAPRIEYAEPGIMVSAFLTATTLTATDVADQRRRVAQLLGRFHREMATHVSGPGFMSTPRSSSSAAASSAVRRPIIWPRPQGRCPAAGAGQADIRLDLACRRSGRPAALLRLDHAGAEILGRALQGARGGDRAATGWKMTGCLRLATNEDRWTEFKRQATTASSFGMEMHLISPEEAKGCGR
jgi:hypothetical protein